MDGLEFAAIWTAFLSVFSCNSIEVNHYIQFFLFGCHVKSSLHTLPGHVPYRYVMTPSGVRIFNYPANIFSANIECLTSKLLLRFQYCLVFLQTLSIILEFCFSFGHTLFCALCVLANKTFIREVAVHFRLHVYKPFHLFYS